MPKTLRGGVDHTRTLRLAGRRLAGLSRRKRVLLTALCFCASPTASYCFEGCVKAADGHFLGEFELVECAAGSLTEKDAKLNHTYKVISRRLAGDASRRRHLVEAERRWIAKRDSTCKDRVEGEGVIGRTATFVLLACAADETDKRIKQLEALDPRKGPD